MYIPQNILDKVNQWSSPTFDENTKKEIEQLMTSNPKELEDAFYKDLAFGTGGMRGVMGVGTNRINRYTLGKNTQGLSDYLKTAFPNEDLKVAIKKIDVTTLCMIYGLQKSLQQFNRVTTNHVVTTHLIFLSNCPVSDALKL